MNAPLPSSSIKLSLAASDALEREIARGARELIANPNRASYIIRRAVELSPRELELACNRWLENCRDFNRALGFLQLRRACDTPEFAAVWRAYQAEMAGEAQ